MSYGYAYPYNPPSASSGAPYGQQMNKFWLIQKDIHRKVITAKIRDYLGPEATVRSYTKDGEDGYLVTTPGEFLTDDQIDDICNESTEMWERQAFDRLGDLSNVLLKRPLHQPVVIYRAARPGGPPSGASAYGPAPGFAPYGPPPPPPASPFAPPPHVVSDARAARPSTPRNSSSGSSSSRRHGGHQHHHSRHHRSYSAGGSFSLPHAPSAGSSLRWEPNTMQEEDMDYDESYHV